MNKRKTEFYVGIFVIIGVVCVSYLFVVLGKLNVHRDKYSVHAYFTSASGLKEGARVEMAGVEIGSVAMVSLDMEKYLAKVELKIDDPVVLTDDVIVSVKTSGIIGEKFVDIAPGGSFATLKPGDEIFNTEASLDIESLVRKFIFQKDAN